MKTGKSINSAYLKNIIEQKGGILLKTSAKKGNKFYFADLLSVDISLEKQMLFPNYYKEYLYYNGYELDDVKKSGFWFKIKNVREISENEVRSFIVTSNEKPIYDYAVKTRVVHMYIHNDNDLKI